MEIIGSILDFGLNFYGDSWESLELLQDLEALIPLLQCLYWSRTYIRTALSSCEEGSSSPN
jgi:hypothetical protein